MEGFGRGRRDGGKTFDLDESESGPDEEKRYVKEHARRGGMGKVLASGGALLLLEGLLLLYWFGSGIYVIVHDAYVPPGGKKVLLEHMLGAFHFPVMLVLAMIREEYGELKIERQRQKEGEEKEAGKRAEITAPFLLSWFVAVIVSLGTDIFLLASILIVESNPTETIEVVETCAAFWALGNTILVILWSVWVYAKFQRKKAKLRAKK